MAAGLAGLVLAATAAGCTGDSGTDSADRQPDPTRSIQRYVALGDSFTAAPFVPDVVQADGCYRSTSNYPSVVARNLPEAELVDVSCSGADTTHLRKPQRTVVGSGSGTRVPPQFDALTADTDLVTVGIGGNDFNVFGRMITRCPELIRTDPDGAPCREAMQGPDGDRLRAAVSRTAKRVTRVLEQVRDLSPDARVLLVNYPQVAPAEGACDQMPLADGDYAYARQVSEWLDQALRDAAEAAGAELVDAWTASEGHDVCSEDPWVNGKDTDFSRALSFHPFIEGQSAVATLVLDTLRH